MELVVRGRRTGSKVGREKEKGNKRLRRLERKEEGKTRGRNGKEEERRK